MEKVNGKEEKKNCIECLTSVVGSDSILDTNQMSSVRGGEGNDPVIIPPPPPPPTGN